MKYLVSPLFILTSFKVLLNHLFERVDFEKKCSVSIELLILLDFQKIQEVN